MRINRILFPGLVVGLLVLGGVAPAQETIYRSIPGTYPGSFPSLGFQATSSDEFGDHIRFSGVHRDLGNVVVSLTNWACENDFDLVAGAWVAKRLGSEACETTPGSGFDHPITLNIYAVDDSGADPAVGALLVSRTESFFIPFRPSWDAASCPDPSTDVPFGGTWFDPVLGACVHGFAFNIEFDFSGDEIVLPEEVIFGVAYNTHTHGETPIGAPGPYSSLNVSLDTAPPTIGTDAEPGTVFWDTSFGPFYCDSGAGGTDTFRRDAGCWTTTGDGTGDPYTPVVEFHAFPPTPADKNACKKGGWKALFRADGTTFKNQGDCIQYVNTGK